MDQIILSGKSEDTPLIIGEMFMIYWWWWRQAREESSPVKMPAC